MGEQGETVSPKVLTGGIAVLTLPPESSSFGGTVLGFPS